MTEPLRPEHKNLLTPAELEAAVLYDLGWGIRKIAWHLGVSSTTVRDRLDRAAQRIHLHDEGKG